MVVTPLETAKAEARVVRAAMAWLRWMEKVKRAEAWLKHMEPVSERAIPNLLKATDSLRKARRKR